MSKKIPLTLENHGYSATFEPGNPWNMPAGIPLPLPWGHAAHSARVASDLLERFAGAVIVASDRAYAAGSGVTFAVRRPRGSYRRR